MSDFVGWVEGAERPRPTATETLSDRAYGFGRLNTKDFCPLNNHDDGPPLTPAVLSFGVGTTEINSHPSSPSLFSAFSGVSAPSAERSRLVITLYSHLTWGATTGAGGCGAGGCGAGGAPG